MTSDCLWGRWPAAGLFERQLKLLVAFRLATPDASFKEPCGHEEQLFEQVRCARASCENIEPGYHEEEEMQNPTSYVTGRHTTRCTGLLLAALGNGFLHVPCMRDFVKVRGGEHFGNVHH